MKYWLTNQVIPVPIPYPGGPSYLVVWIAYLVPEEEAR
jgi:hypothetical protein